MKKQLGIKIRLKYSAVKIHDLKTCLMIHATGVLFVEKVLSSLEDNEMKLLLLQSLRIDGPNVSKTVWNQ